MSDRPKAEIFMQFVQRGSSGAVLAECAAEKNEDDDFMEDFNPAAYDTYSDFFEVQKFQFAVQVKDEDSTKKDTQEGSKSASPVKKTEKLATGAFATWRSATKTQINAMQYPFQPGQFSFSRVIDRASPIFAQACCNSESFLSATLVKRVSLGGNETPMSFLQIKFDNVLIVGLDWDDGDLTSETCKFICRGFEVKYRKQGYDGTLDEVTSQASWKQEIGKS